MRISWVVKIHRSIDFGRCGYETVGKLAEFLAQGRRREAVAVVLVTGGAKILLSYMPDTVIPETWSDLFPKRVFNFCPNPFEKY
ncbi:hypothetical protein QYF36_018168 [Acer negundo]|nr:hypothetical protein QYF36_018168 [Acer negundo]